MFDLQVIYLMNQSRQTFDSRPLDVSTFPDFNAAFSLILLTSHDGALFYRLCAAYFLASLTFWTPQELFVPLGDGQHETDASRLTTTSEGS